MGFRFTRRMKIAPGLNLNLSKRGGSLSFGPRGAKLTVGTSGVRTTGGIPGTGLYYTQKLDKKSTGSQARSQSIPYAPVSPRNRLQLGFFQRLFLPKEEQAWVDGCREMSNDNTSAAMLHLQQVGNHADAAFLLAILTSKENRFEEARNHLLLASNNEVQLGTYFNKYGVWPETSLPVTDELHVTIAPDIQGVLLMLVEIYQQLNTPQEALVVLDRLIQLAPEDVVVKLSYVELLTEEYFDNKHFLQKAVQLAEGIENESDIHTGILYYKGKALRGLGLFEAAKETLTLALRRKKDRPDELLLSIQYERALVHEAMGKKSQARSDFEKIYAKSTDFEDVAERLGLEKLEQPEESVEVSTYSEAIEPTTSTEPTRPPIPAYLQPPARPIKNPSKERTPIISWIASCFFLLSGIVGIADAMGWVFIGMGLLLLPPITRKIEESGNFKMTWGMKILIVIVGFVVAGIVAN